MQNGSGYRVSKQSVAHESQPYYYYYVVYTDEVTIAHTHTHTNVRSLYHIDINCQMACERTLGYELKLKTSHKTC